MPVQISVFWTLPHQPGHTGKICPAVRADRQIERMRADRNAADTSEALLSAFDFSFTMRINSRKAEGKTGKQEKRTGERADPQESEHERQTESQNESASS